MIWQGILNFLQELLELHNILAQRYGDIKASLISTTTVISIIYIFFSIAISLLRLWEKTARALNTLFQYVKNRSRSQSIQTAEKILIERRQRFAIYVQSQIERINNQESWSDYRFAELEAEIEVEGKQKRNHSKTDSQQSSIRRVPSLTAALEASLETTILLEGEPGSGKSVALRQVALRMARIAKESNHLNNPIPLYINLKELDRSKLNNLVVIDTGALRRILPHIFNLDEIRLLCHDLGIQYEDLPGETLTRKCTELVAYCDRGRSLSELVAVCRQHRPKVESLATISKLNPVNHQLIREFILFSLNKVNDRDIEIFLEETFDKGLRDKQWLFLFDSFDEIPEILGATEADKLIQQYGDAISDFLGGMNNCRGVIASRHYRGPKQFSWTRFRVLPLKKNRQETLIHKSQLSEDMAANLIAHIRNARSDMQSMASNPLFLSLLCEYAQRTKVFPLNIHAVYEEYIGNRLERDRHRLHERFGLTPLEVRGAAEKLAFVMMADEQLGLSPTRAILKGSLTRVGLLPAGNFSKLLDALEFLKLARTDNSNSDFSPRLFTFAHRRFQEYFATSIVLREPNRISSHELLSDGRWRETAVVLCQTQPQESLGPLMLEAVKMLSDFEESVSKSNHLKKTLMPKSFPWPPNALHILGILQAGFENRPDILSGFLKRKSGGLLWQAHQTGMHFDKVWCLEVAGASPQPILLRLIQSGLRAKGKQRDLAYRQIERLKFLSEDVSKYIFNILCNMYADGSLYKDQHVMRSFLNRIPNSDQFLRGMDLFTKLYKFEIKINFSFALMIIFLSIFFDQRAWAFLLSGFTIGLIALVRYPFKNKVVQEGSSLIVYGGSLFWGSIFLGFGSLQLAIFVFALYLVFLLTIFAIYVYIKNGLSFDPLILWLKSVRINRTSFHTKTNKINKTSIKKTPKPRELRLIEIYIWASTMLLLAIIFLLIWGAFRFVLNWSEISFIILLFGLVVVVLASLNLENRYKNIKESQQILSGIQFLNNLAYLRRSEERLSYIRHVRKNRLITPVTSNIEVIHQFAVVLERSKVVKDLWNKELSIHYPYVEPILLSIGSNEIVLRYAPKKLHLYLREKLRLYEILLGSALWGKTDIKYLMEESIEDFAVWYQKYTEVNPLRLSNWFNTYEGAPHYTVWFDELALLLQELHLQQQYL